MYKMSASLPAWLRDVVYGSHGDIYTVDTNNCCLEKHVCCENEMWYNRPLKVHLSSGQPDGVRPISVTFLDNQDDQRRRILVTMDNESLVMLSVDMTIQDKVKLKGRASGITVATLPQDGWSSPDPAIVVLNATDSSLDLINTCGARVQSVPLPQKLGLRETHGYLACGELEGRTVLVMSSSRGVYCSTLYLTDRKEWAVKFSAEILADDQFSPQGICLVDNFLYIANSRKDRVMKMNLRCEESDDVIVEHVTYMGVTSPCAVHGRKADNIVSVCVTTLTGRYEILHF